MESFTNFLYVTLLIFLVVMFFNIAIFIHELGHFLAGKWRGLKIDRFQIWFGKPIWKKTYKGVQYGLGWIPAGGFVSLPQMAPMESIEGKTSDEEPLPPITPLDKIIVAAAGPLFSILLALAAAVVVWKVGKPKDFVPSETIGYVKAESPADVAGLKMGDKILSINGKRISGFAGTFDSITESIVLSSGDELVFEVERPGVSETVKLTSRFEQEDTKWFQRSGMRKIGIAAANPVKIGGLVANSPAAKAGLEVGDTLTELNGEPLYSIAQIMSFLAENEHPEITLEVTSSTGENRMVQIQPVKPISPKAADPMLGIRWDTEGYADFRIIYPNPFTQVADTANMMWVTISTVANPKSSIGVDHLSGPVGIGTMLYNLLQTENGWRRILGFMVLLNVNLAILNLLPFPVLDGGHITLAIFEKIMGRPVHAKPLEIVQTFCALALMGLMLYITSKDLGDHVGPKDERESGEVVFAE